MQTRGRFTGLHTAVAETSAPDGALRVADNVVMRKEGVLSPRQGFVPEPLGYTPADAESFLAAHPYGASTLYETTSGFRSTGGALLTYFETPRRLRADVRSTVEMRGNLYAAFHDSVLKLSAPAQTGWEITGLFPHYLGASQWYLEYVPAGILPFQTHVGYRMVGVKTDANGVLLRSRPSGMVVMRNDVAAYPLTALPWLSISIAYPSLLDALEIYRTRVFPVTAALDEEMQLIATLPRSLFGGGTYIFKDGLPDSARGTTLYTSPSRGGIENANDRPPGCAVMALYKRSLFFANTVSPQRLLLSYTVNLKSFLTTASGIGQRLYKGDAVQGQRALTNLSSTAGIEIGMRVTAAVSGVVARVTGINGTTVTIDADVPISATNQDLFFNDIIEVNGVAVLAADFANNDISYRLTQYPALAGRIGAYVLTPSKPGFAQTAVIETVLSDQAPFSLRATHGKEYNPPLPSFSEAVTPEATSRADVFPNGLAWSSPDEPEHVPQKFFAQVGEQRKAILALATTRDSLFVIKEDGIFRVTGTNGNFRIDPFDLTTFCILPSSVRTLQGRTYFLAQKGLVALDDSGVEVVSAPIADELSLVVEHVRAQRDSSTSIYRYAGFVGDVGATDDRNHEYLLALPEGVTSFGGDVLVYHTLHEAFTTYSFRRGTAPFGFTPSGYGVRHDGVPLVLHAGGVRAGQSFRTTVAGASFPRTSDAILPAPGNATVLADGTVRLVLDAPLTLRVGDVVASVQHAARVVAVESTTQVILSQPVSGTRAAYRAITCTCEPHGFTSPPLAGKLWTHVVWACTRLVGATFLEARFTSATPTVDLAAQEVREQVPVPLGQGGVSLHPAGTLLRVNVPSVHKRGWLLRAALAVELAFGDMLLELVSADSRENLPQKTQTHSTGGT